MMLSVKFMKFETTTTEKNAHKNHLSRSQVVGRFVQEFNLTTTIRCLICHWRTQCLQLTWQYFDHKFLGSREMVLFSAEKRVGGVVSTHEKGPSVSWDFSFGEKPDKVRQQLVITSFFYFFWFFGGVFFLENLPLFFTVDFEFFFQRQRCSWLPVLRWCFDHFRFSVDAPGSWLTWVTCEYGVRSSEDGGR